MEAYQQLEKEYTGFAQSKYAVSCSSGTAALHLALLSLGVGKGDEVIVPDFTMAACGFAVSYTGAKPVFVDVDPLTYGLDQGNLERSIHKNTKAIMVVHVYGRLANMDAILRIARKYRIPVIEDACEAQGAVKNSKALMTCYSLYRNKIIHAEEGGIITTDKKSLVKRINYLKNMAFGPKHDYFHKEVGYNYRLPNAEALLALKSLREYENNNRKRRTIEKWYTEYLASPMKKRDAVWFYEIPVSVRAKNIILKKIPGARHSFKPLSSFPMYGGGKGGPVSASLSKSLILLPAHPSMTKQEVKEICSVVNQNIFKYEKNH